MRGGESSVHFLPQTLKLTSTGTVTILETTGKRTWRKMIRFPGSLMADGFCCSNRQINYFFCCCWKLSSRGRVQCDCTWLTEERMNIWSWWNDLVRCKLNGKLECLLAFNRKLSAVWFQNICHEKLKQTSFLRWRLVYVAGSHCICIHFGFVFFFLAQAFQERDPERRNKNTLVLSLMFLLLGVITLATYIIQVSVTMLKC